MYFLNGGFEECPFIIIEGSADFDRSPIKSLGKLKRIKGRAFFEFSQVTDIGQLESIGGYVDFGPLKDLKKQWEARQEALKKKKITGQDIKEFDIPNENESIKAENILNGAMKTEEEKGS